MAKEVSNEDEEDGSSTLELLRDFEDGQFLAEVDQSVEDVCRKVLDCGKAGAVTVQLKVETRKGGQLVIKPVLKTSMPSSEFYPAVRFMEDGKLTGENPATKGQKDLDFGEGTKLTSFPPKVTA